MKKIFISAFLTELMFVFAFIWFSWSADQAMGKDGVGNHELWQQYSSNAGVAFYIAGILWVLSIIFSVFTKNFKSFWSQLTIGIPPLVLLAGWLFTIWGLT